MFLTAYLLASCHNYTSCLMSGLLDPQCKTSKLLAESNAKLIDKESCESATIYGCRNIIITNFWQEVGQYVHCSFMIKAKSKKYFLLDYRQQRAVQLIVCVPIKLNWLVNEDIF